METLPHRRLPAEWERQDAVLLTWPHAATDWNSEPGLLDEVTTCYLHLAQEIAKREQLIVVTPEPENVIILLEKALPPSSLLHVSLLECATDDTWARDHGPIILADGTALDFRFNGWGGKYPAEKDNAISRHLFDSGLLPCPTYENCLDFELEGGSIESDGHGTILTTVRCNQNPNRRGQHSNVQEEVEAVFRQRLGAERVLWLRHGGLEQDDTDGHIDTLARFCPNDTIIYGGGDEQMLDELQTFRTPSGHPYRLLEVPPYYANFLVINGAVLLPYYEDAQQNSQATAVLQQAFPEREIVGIDCRVLLRQNGSLHCCTMQIPTIC